MSILHSSIRRVWHSPTFMTWASFFARTLNAGVVLFLVVQTFPEEEVALWLLFLMAINLQFMLDMGFMATFARVVAYAMGGTEDLGDFRDHQAKGSGEPNWTKVEQIVATTRVVYGRLALAMIALSVLLITPALIRPVGEVVHPVKAWCGWAVIVFSSASIFYARVFASYLQGVNEIPRWRRGEAVTGLAAASCCMATLWLGGGILELVLARQCCYVLGNVFYNRYLCGVVHHGRWKTFRPEAWDAQVFKQIWPRSWRTGVGELLSLGLTLCSGFVYAQFAAAGAVSSYLLAIRVMETVVLFSQAPFYSKLPYLARLRSSGMLTDQVQIAQRGMKLAYWIFVGGMLTAGLTAQPILSFVEADTRFVHPVLWSWICIAYFIQRHDSMHLQFYSLTNHIIWHTINAVTFVVVVAVTLALVPWMGILAFPIGLLTGHLSFYTWYVCRHSYRAFDLSIRTFEAKTILKPLITLLAGLAIYVYLW